MSNLHFQVQSKNLHHYLNIENQALFIIYKQNSFKECNINDSDHDHISFNLLIYLSFSSFVSISCQAWSSLQGLLQSHIILDFDEGTKWPLSPLFLESCIFSSFIKTLQCLFVFLSPSLDEIIAIHLKFYLALGLSLEFNPKPLLTFRVESCSHSKLCISSQANSSYP